MSFTAWRIQGDNLRLAYPHPFPVSHWSVRGVGERGKEAGVRVAPGQAGCGSVQPAWGGGFMLATPVERQPPPLLAPSLCPLEKKLF